MALLSFKTSREGSVAVVTLAGELDVAGCPGLESEVERLLAELENLGQ